MQPCRKDTTAGIVTFASDPNGNLTSRVSTTGSTAYAWDVHDRLTQVSDGTTTAQYVYNGAGTRIARRINGVTTRFIVDPQPALSQLLVETDETGTPTARYVYGLGLIERVDASGQVAYYHFDPRGSTVAMTDTSQAVVNSYAYDEFGAVLNNNQQTLAQPFTYVGQFGVMQEPNGLRFMRARYYDTATGRFLSKDPVSAGVESPQNINGYPYVLNDPIAVTDPLGTSPWDIFRKVVDVGTELVKQVAREGVSRSWNWATGAVSPSVSYVVEGTSVIRVTGQGTGSWSVEQVLSLRDAVKNVVSDIAIDKVLDAIEGERKTIKPFGLSVSDFIPGPIGIVIDKIFFRVGVAGGDLDCAGADADYCRTQDEQLRSMEQTSQAVIQNRLVPETTEVTRTVVKKTKKAKRDTQR